MIFHKMEDFQEWNFEKAKIVIFTLRILETVLNCSEKLSES